MESVLPDLIEPACFVKEQACFVKEQACFVKEQACFVKEQACRGICHSRRALQTRLVFSIYVSARRGSCPE